MQIDFHLGVTYVLCRMAGFKPEDSNIISGGAQFVDDAVHSGTLSFDNNFMYEFRASAHKDLDYRNFKALANRQVWVPFHFLPSGEGHEPLVCRPNSKIAKHMLNEVKEYFMEPIGLHLLGVTLHTYADTWAHQGFSGFTNEHNAVEEIFDSLGKRDEMKMKYRRDYFNAKKPCWKRLWEKFVSSGISSINPIGHGAALSFPDQPFLRWKYKDSTGKIITRNNPEDYMDAVEHILNFLSDLRKSFDMSAPAVQESDKIKIRSLLESIQHEQGNERLSQWKQEVESGAFSFGNDTWNYSNLGASCWTQDYFGILQDNEFELKNVIYQPHFLSSNWKLAYDALALHRFLVIHKILPQYNLCVL